MSFDFSAEKYRQLCERLVAAGYHSIRFADYLTQRKAPGKKLVLLRHDVDRFPKAALRLAELEQAYGLCASYYFRIPVTFKPKIIAEVHSLGHEIGLHYEVLDKAKGDIVLAARFLEADLAQLREIAPVEIAGMHGNPLSRFNNRDIWQYLDLNDYGLLGEAYLSVDFANMLYFSDTGRTWKRNRFNIYDRLPTQAAEFDNMPEAENTDDLIEIIRHGNRDMYILTHPERWPASFPRWLLSRSLDAIANPLKILFQFIHQFGR